MVISARVHYACLALTELATRGADSAPVAAAEITLRHGIPGPFLVQILRTLRAAGWVESIRAVRAVTESRWTPHGSLCWTSPKRSVARTQTATWAPNPLGPMRSCKSSGMMLPKRRDAYWRR